MSTSDDAKRFRKRATDCRELAKNAREDVDRVMLENMADELDAEADKIEAQTKAAARSSS